jgi:Leucine-rich repeat (LRR) protein
MDTLKIAGLRMLHIENCGLSVIPSDISKLAASLKKLKLPRNKLSQIPDSTAELATLELLDLNHNTISQLPASLFSGMARLKELNLSNNRLSSLPSSISACLQLKLLDLSHNRYSICKFLLVRSVVRSDDVCTAYTFLVPVLPSPSHNHLLFVSSSFSHSFCVAHSLTALPAETGLLSALEDLDIRYAPPAFTPSIFPFPPSPPLSPFLHP